MSPAPSAASAMMGHPSWSGPPQPGSADDVCDDNRCSDLADPYPIAPACVTAPADGADTKAAFGFG
jgi:hypothetical protein